MSKKTPLADTAARERIVTDLRGSMLVEAGAGSGKTHMMAARMAAGIASRQYRIEHLAAVTFTRKAAAELRGRVQIALEEQLTRDPENAVVREALSQLERFFAGTIHSFCARLLRERPVEAGVSPGFTELDDLQDRLLRRQSWRDYRAQAKAQGDPDVELLLDAGIPAKDLDGAFEKICMHEDVEFPAGRAPLPDDAGGWRELEAFWMALSTYLPSPIADETTCGTQKKARQFAREWRMVASGRRTSARLAALLQAWDYKPGITQMWWADDTATKKRLNQVVTTLHEDFRTNVVTPYLTAWRQYLYGPCVRVLMAARRAAADERRRRDVLNFSDLLLLTAKVLGTNADVRHALQQKYRWIFVDEFQDTDPLQAEILTLLASGEGGGLRPGALFVVGDPKQSIFRFTRADIDIYNEVHARLAGPDGTGIVSLTTNFRSVPSLCGWANAVFESRFPAAADTYAPKYTSLDAARENEHAAGLHTITIAATTKQADVSAEEAARIARFIRVEVDAGRREYEDFLILTRMKGRHLKPYAEALEAAQIPVEVTGAGAFGDSAEVAALGLLLRALADPQDSVSLVGVLRGPLFGLSDRDLFEFRRAGGSFSVYSIGDASDAVVAAVASLNEMFRWTRVLPAGAALERILERTGYLALAAASPGGVEAGDLLHAVDRVRTVVEAGFSLLDAAEALDDDAEESSEVESLPLEPGRRNVVRLMNMHKAKGLEAAVVFLADPCGGYDPKVDLRIVRDRSGGSAVGYLQIKAKFGEHGAKLVAEPADWPAHDAEERKYLDAEAERLLYVAATRARDVMVVGRWAKLTGGTRAWGALNDALGDAIELKDVGGAAQPKLPTSKTASSLAPALAAIAAAHARSRRPTWSATSVTAELKHLPRITVGPADAADAADPTQAVLPNTSSRRADAGMAWGTLVHGLLEHAMRHSAATGDDLRRLAMWLTVEEPQLRMVIDQAIDTVQSVAGAAFWQQALASAERHEETPFAVCDRTDAVPTITNGAIDLVFRTTDGWRLIDYKTDVDGASGKLQAKYDEQLRAYVSSWEGISGNKVRAEVLPVRRSEKL